MAFADSVNGYDRKETTQELVLKFWLALRSRSRSCDPKYERLANNVTHGLCEPQWRTKLLNRYFDDCMLADELGRNIMTNEHHSTATCMAVSRRSHWRSSRGKRRGVVSGAWHAISSSQRSVRVARNGLGRVISGGRLKWSLIRGAPIENSAVGTNPNG